MQADPSPQLASTRPGSETRAVGDIYSMLHVHIRMYSINIYLQWCIHIAIGQHVQYIYIQLPVKICHPDGSHDAHSNNRHRHCLSNHGYHLRCLVGGRCIQPSQSPLKSPGSAEHNTAHVVRGNITIFIGV